MIKHDNEISMWRTSTIRSVVLNILSEKTATGYQIMKDIRERSLGLLKVESGIIYPLLNKLEKDGYITGEWIDGSRKKRMYKLTEKGMELTIEIESNRKALREAHNNLFQKLGMKQESDNDFRFFNPATLSTLSIDERKKTLSSMNEKIGAIIKALTEKKKEIERMLKSMQ
ncbi:MAG: PadR family transcriptional regulator [Candidatus Thermoplasmatota archaeon]|jgi:DNA-binding PadR family transcriptional regulator|nr:PadR family transcriptional regulator [Candidatus Thermoplasmatota archaeon]MCL5963508.1 PadR family transcriptional regulator [Candidatus Thermoplasmatota archaeon]